MSRPKGVAKVTIRIETSILREVAEHLKNQVPGAADNMARLNSLSGAIQTINTAIAKDAAPVVIAPAEAPVAVVPEPIADAPVEPVAEAPKPRPTKKAA